MIVVFWLEQRANVPDGPDARHAVFENRCA